MATDSEGFFSQLAPGGNQRVIAHFLQEVTGGKNWYLALLEAVGEWSQPEETHSGRLYRYLIAGEAFDFLLLAERLCEVAGGLIPEDEKAALLFHGQPPVQLSSSEFKRLIGVYKYRQYLNYFYGVTVEEALFLAVQSEVRKERRASGYSNERDVTNEVFRRLYGSTKGTLLKRFRKEKSYPNLKSIRLTELTEFNYWLFKVRLEKSDKARFASDIKKALKWLSGEKICRGLTLYEPPAILD